MLETLRHDHRQLTPHLRTVEIGLDVGPSAWPILKDACATLMVALDEHMAREKVLLTRVKIPTLRAAFHKGIPTHEAQARELKAVVRQLLTKKEGIPKGFDARMYELLDDLEQGCDEQERWLFSIIERRQKAKSQAAELGLQSHESPTINRLVQRYQYRT